MGNGSSKQSETTENLQRKDVSEVEQKCNHAENWELKYKNLAKLVSDSMNVELYDVLNETKSFKEKLEGEKDFRRKVKHLIGNPEYRKLKSLEKTDENFESMTIKQKVVVADNEIPVANELTEEEETVLSNYNTIKSQLTETNGNDQYYVLNTEDSEENQVTMIKLSRIRKLEAQIKTLRQKVSIQIY